MQSERRRYSWLAETSTTSQELSATREKQQSGPPRAPETALRLRVSLNKCSQSFSCPCMSFLTIVYFYQE